MDSHDRAVAALANRLFKQLRRGFPACKMLRAESIYYPSSPGARRLTVKRSQCTAFTRRAQIRARPEGLSRPKGSSRQDQPNPHTTSSPARPGIGGLYVQRNVVDWSMVIDGESRTSATAAYAHDVVAPHQQATPGEKSELVERQARKRIAINEANSCVDLRHRRWSCAAPLNRHLGFV